MKVLEEKSHPSHFQGAIIVNVPETGAFRLSYQINLRHLKTNAKSPKNAVQSTFTDLHAYLSPQTR